MKPTHFILVFLCSFISFGQIKYDEVYDSQQIIEAGIVQHDAENFSEAIALYEKVAITDPQYLLATYEKLYSLGLKEDIESQKKLYEEIYATDLMDKMPEFYILYGVFLSNQDAFEKSEQVFNRAKKYLPLSSFLNYNMAILYIRMKETQKAVDHLKICITYNPNHASSHYLLGLLALENGRISQGCMALMGYLINNPGGNFASEAVLKLNENMGKTNLEVSNIVFSEKGDDFSELDIILRNQLALNSKYKLKSKIDETVTRQAQAVLEYASSHVVKDGFFEEIYIPLYATIYKRDYTTGFLAYMLVSMEEQIGKKLKSEKKNIMSFIEDFIKKDFWDFYASRNLEHFGSKQKVVIWLDEGKPFMVGKNNGAIKQGKYKIVNEYFQRVSELSYVDNELDGLQTYYYLNENKSEETNFKAGVRNGASTDYYENGMVKAIGNYKDGELDGLLQTFSPFGAKVCELNFAMGKRQGVMQCFYADGTMSSENFYEAGELNGTSTVKNQLGDVVGIYNYKKDLLDGDYIEYFDGKVLKSKSTYKEGVIGDVRTTYYENGNVKSVEDFVNGKYSKNTTYFANGSISTIYNYDSDEKIQNIAYYNTQNKIYFEEEYEKGLLKKAFQYNQNDPNKVVIEFKKSPFMLKNLFGITISKGKMVNGKNTGLWEYYSHTGVLKSIENFKDGAKDGIQKDYDISGELSTTYNVENGEIHGLLTFHKNNAISGSQYYKEGMKNGPFQFFYKTGKLSYEGFYKENEQGGLQIGYRQDGTLLSKRVIKDDYLMTFTNYLLDGKTVDYSVDYKDLDGLQTIVSNDGLIISKSEYTKGFKNGKSIVKDKTESPISECTIVNNQLNGIYKKYNPNGTLNFVANYYNNMIHGEALYYDLMGSLRFKTAYSFDENQTTGIRFYQNKSKLYTYEEVNNYKDGPYVYYNIKGEPIVQINYVMDLPISYQVLNEKNQLGEPVQKQGDFKIISKYNNGKTAFEMEFKNNLPDGTIKVFGLDGTLHYSCGMKKNQLDGDRIEYYESGKTYKHERLKDNDFEGLQSYFATDGTKLVEANYAEDELHGDFVIYKNGSAFQTKKYNSDEIYEIIQH
uniref:hypothetical protein n=1 Tax=Flavobacterium sp. TaxID=239 RepID=UPI00404B47A6